MAAEDIVTLEEAQRLLQLDGRVDATTLAMYITAASRRIDAICGPVVSRRGIDRLDGGAATVRLTTPPILTISDVQEWDGASVTVLAEELPFAFPAPIIPADGYLADLQTGVLRRRKSGADSQFPAGHRNVKVLYDAGRYATTADVDGRFKEATMMLVQQLWRREQSSGSVTLGMADTATWVPSYAVPKAVLELLADEVLPPGVA